MIDNQGISGGTRASSIIPGLNMDTNGKPNILPTPTGVMVNHDIKIFNKKPPTKLQIMIFFWVIKYLKG